MAKKPAPKPRTAEKPRPAASVAQPATSAGAVAIAQPETHYSWPEFTAELQTRAKEIAPMLPSNISVEKFVNTAIAAVKQNPEILLATKRSLFSAITKAALDGMLPDGKEGFINVYNSKVPNSRPERWEKVATWSPMAYGMRKRARELDGILIDAQVVYENDLFKRVQGDHPAIIHEPVKPGAPEGPMIAAYAIFKREDGTILGREVMNAAQVAMVRAQSKAPDSLMWTKFETEGWRKSVIRRGIKSVPVSEKLELIVRRSDEEFDFTGSADIPAGVALPGRTFGGNEFTRGPARHHRLLQEWTAKGNYAQTIEELDAIHKAAKDALPPEVWEAFLEFLNGRADAIEAAKARAAIPGPEASSEAPQAAQTGRTGGDGRPEPPALGGPVQGQEGGAGPEAPEDPPELTPEAAAALDAILAGGRARLPQVTNSLGLAELRDVIEQDLPPESQQLKDWIKDCETRQAELLAATKPK